MRSVRHAGTIAAAAAASTTMAAAAASVRGSFTDTPKTIWRMTLIAGSDSNAPTAVPAIVRPMPPSAAALSVSYGCGPERDANTQLAPPLGDGAGDQAVHADDAQNDRDARQHGQQPRERARRRHDLTLHVVNRPELIERQLRIDFAQRLSECGDDGHRSLRPHDPTRLKPVVREQERIAELRGRHERTGDRRHGSAALQHVVALLNGSDDADDFDRRLRRSAEMDEAPHHASALAEVTTNASLTTTTFREDCLSPSSNTRPARTGVFSVRK